MQPKKKKNNQKFLVTVVTSVHASSRTYIHVRFGASSICVCTVHINIFGRRRRRCRRRRLCETSKIICFVLHRKIKKIFTTSSGDILCKHKQTHTHTSKSIKKNLENSKNCQPKNCRRCSGKIWKALDVPKMEKRLRRIASPLKIGAR